jgi:hypothetical protein
MLILDCFKDIIAMYRLQIDRIMNLRKFVVCSIFACTMCKKTHESLQAVIKGEVY